MGKRNHSFRSLIFIAFFMLCSILSSATAGAQGLDDGQCARLAGLKIEDVNLLSAAVVPASGDVPGYCRVLGYVRPQINFEVRMPLSGWNAKFYMAGCGGWCGKVDTDRPGFTNSAVYGLRRNYAVVAHDSGHWGTGPTDGTWAYHNRQMEIDWAYRAVHEVARASKVLIGTYYGQSPAFSYFVGCSTGGRQAALEAQRYPEDFDGIISGSPVLNETGLVTFLAWLYQANRESGGKLILNQSKVKLIEDAVYSACDGLDGLSDGIISDPRKCSFDPERLLCSGSSTGGCLTAAEVQVLKKFYGGVRDSSGRSLYPGGLPFGSEAFWPLWAVAKEGSISTDDDFVESGLKYVLFENDPGAEYSPLSFNFDRDPSKLEFVGKMCNATDPDLGRFRERRGKIIFYHGWADSIVTPFYTVEYFESVVKKMGAGAAQEVARLFMVPGMDHCSILPGRGPDQFDVVTALENWVEKGQAPEQIVAAQLDKDKKIVRTRPLCAYPKAAKYKGSGSPEEAANFTCENP